MDRNLSVMSDPLWIVASEAVALTVDICPDIVTAGLAMPPPLVRLVDIYGNTALDADLQVIYEARTCLLQCYVQCNMSICND